jgi:hypothetical protein
MVKIVRLTGRDHGTGAYLPQSNVSGSGNIAPAAR